MIFIVESFFSGCISKVINDGKDYSWTKIKNMISDRQDQNISTKICRVIERTLNIVTDKRYKDSDDLYDAIEIMFNEFRNNKNAIDAVKSGLGFLCPDVTTERCENFIDKFYTEICKDEELCKRISLFLKEKDIEINRYGFQRINDKLDSLDEKISRKSNDGFSFQRKEPIKSRTQEYFDKWNENMFLNNYNIRDENSGVNIKLHEVYLKEYLPPYIWRGNENSHKDLDKLLCEYINNVNENKMLLILGQAGIGKSTLLTWIIANFSDCLDRIFIYQFASDLKKVNWQREEVLIEILKTVNLDYNEMENKILILDGFDEIYVEGRNREKLLNQFHQELTKIHLLRGFSLIITCRENYVLELQKVECDFITLQTWDIVQIKSFCKTYIQINKNKILRSTINKLVEYKEIFGIPLILYMVLALDITIEKNASIVDVYDRIFSLDGGSIYDRCIKNLRYGAQHRISETNIKQQIHQVSKEIAFWIFENNSEEAFIPQAEYENICNALLDEGTEESKEIKRDFLIGNYFKLIRHCEGIGTGKLYFVHRSIYEYFVADYIFKAIYNLQCNEEIAGELGKILKRGILSKQVLEFVKCKFDSCGESYIPNAIKQVFQVMLQNGMTYYTKENYKNVIDREVNIFSNMLKVVNLWNKVLGKIGNEIINFLQYNNRSELWLEGTELEAVNLDRVYLVGANLNGSVLNKIKMQGAYLNGAKLIGAYLQDAILNDAKLEKADLSKANLIGAQLNKAHLNGAELIGTRLIRAKLIEAELNGAKLNSAELNGADLRGASIEGIELKGAYLRDAIFDEKQAENLAERYDLTSSKIYVRRTEQIINYMDYCRRD